MEFKEYAWLENWLLNNGFFKSHSNTDTFEFVRPLVNGDSVYLQFVDKGENGLRLSIHADAPNYPSSDDLRGPTSINEAKLLLGFHGIDIP